MFFFKLVGADAAQGALVIFGELLALIDITTDGTYEFFHAVSILSLLIHARHKPVKLSWQTST